MRTFYFGNRNDWLKKHKTYPHATKALENAEGEWLFIYDDQKLEGIIEGIGVVNSLLIKFGYTPLEPKRKLTQCIFRPALTEDYCEGYFQKLIDEELEQDDS